MLQIFAIFQLCHAHMVEELSVGHCMEIALWHGLQTAFCYTLSISFNTSI